MSAKKLGNRGAALAWAMMALLMAALLTVTLLPAGFSYAQRSVRSYSDEQAYLTARSAAEAIAAKISEIKGYLYLYNGDDLAAAANPTKEYYIGTEKQDVFIGNGERWYLQNVNFTGHNEVFGDIVLGIGANDSYMRRSGDGDNIEVKITAEAGGKSCTVCAYLHQYTYEETFAIPDDAAVVWTNPGGATPEEKGAPRSIDASKLDPDTLYADYDAANGWVTSVIQYSWVITGYDVQ